MIGSGIAGLVIQSDVSSTASSHATWLANSGASGTRADFTGNDLTGLNLSGQNWTRAIFANANLSSATIDPCTLTDATLTGARMNWASRYLMGEVFRQAYPADAELAPYIAQVTDSTFQFQCWDWFIAQWPAVVMDAALRAACAMAITSDDEAFITNMYSLLDFARRRK